MRTDSPMASASGAMLALRSTSGPATSSTSSPLACRPTDRATAVSWAPPTSSFVMIWTTFIAWTDSRSAPAQPDDGPDRAPNDSQIEAQALVAKIEELVLELL